MITIIHGEDITTSRSFYKNLQKKDKEVFDGEKLTTNIVETFFLSSGLFTSEKQLCVENLFSQKKPSKELDEILQLLDKFAKENDILLWESKELSKKITDQLHHTTIKLFTLPKSLFGFLDSLKPHNTKTMISLYHQTLEQTSAEMVLSMIIRQIRILLALSQHDEQESIEEVNRIQPWQRKKLIGQMQLFSPQSLLQLHKQLFTLEVKSKTGGLPLSLSQSIDFLLLSF